MTWRRRFGRKLRESNGASIRGWWVVDELIVVAAQLRSQAKVGSANQVITHEAEA